MPALVRLFPSLLKGAIDRRRSPAGTQPNPRGRVLLCYYPARSGGREGIAPVERPLSELIAESRRLALHARQNALQASDNEQKREWVKIACGWDAVADGYEQLLLRTMN